MDTRVLIFCVVTTLLSLGTALADDSNDYSESMANNESEDLHVVELNVLMSEFNGRVNEIRELNENSQLNIALDEIGKWRALSTRELPSHEKLIENLYQILKHEWMLTGHALRKKHQGRRAIDWVSSAEENLSRISNEVEVARVLQRDSLLEQKQGELILNGLRDSVDFLNNDHEQIGKMVVDTSKAENERRGRLLLSIKQQLVEANAILNTL